MQKSLLVIAFVAVSQPSVAQSVQQQAPKTKLEAFTGNTGVVTIKSYTDVGRLSFNGEIEVTAMTFRNPNTDRVQSGLSVQIKEYSSRGYGNPARSFIDYDEIAGLIEGIKYVSKITKSITNLDFFETSYQTKGDFRVVTFNDAKGNVSAAIKAGSYSSSTSYVNLQQLGDFLVLVESGKKVLDTTK